MEKAIKIHVKKRHDGTTGGVTAWERLSSRDIGRQQKKSRLESRSHALWG